MIQCREVELKTKEENGRKLMEEGDGMQIYYNYGSDGRLIGAVICTEESTNTLLITRNSRGLITHVQLVDPDSGETYEESHKYDNHGFIRSSKNSLGFRETRCYNSRLNLTYIEDSNGNRREVEGYARDAYLAAPEVHGEFQFWMLHELELV